ncbi:MAG: metallophosphoesterase [Thermoleophilia bacterium]|nr:metallophosphoesterase [Thermoleophilia bacterium]
MQVAIPVPKVPGPVISAPAAASDWGQFFPPKHDPNADENELYEKMEHGVAFMPKQVLDPFWASVKAINKVLFRSGPPNGPVPETPGSWKFSALGDYGGGHSPQDEIAKNVLKGKPDLLVTLGDNVYFNGTEAEFAKKWDPPKWFGKIREEIPVMPSMGNHDVRREPDGIPYFKRFPELNNARFYSYDHKGVHFVSVDTTESLEPGSPQLKWLEKDLAKSEADWKVLYYHHPLLPGQLGMKTPNLGYMSPLIAKYGVDLLLTGHEHNYQRSKPMNANGTIEVLAGGGGESLHPFVTKVPEHNAYRDVDFGHLEVEVTGDKLVGRYIVRDGKVRDTFVLENTTPGVKAATEAGAAAVQPVGAS